MLRYLPCYNQYFLKTVHVLTKTGGRLWLPLAGMNQKPLKSPLNPKVTRDEFKRNPVGVSHLFLLFLYIVSMYENMALCDVDLGLESPEMFC